MFTCVAWLTLLVVLKMMIKATCEKKASPYEHQEMEFLSIVCEKIREDLSIILLYIEVRKCRDLVGG